MKNKIVSGNWKSSVISSIAISILSLAYAIIRYNIVREVAIQQIPLFVFNKAISLSSVIIIGISFLLGPLAKFWPERYASKFYLRKQFGLMGFGLAAIHVLISLLIFDPSYYPRFFVEGKLTLEGELSMLFGVIALFIFSIVAITSIPSVENSMERKKWVSIQRSGYLAFFFVLLHVFFMGYKGWSNSAAWEWGLSPISLIAFIIIAFVLLARIIVIFVKRQNEK